MKINRAKYFIIVGWILLAMLNDYKKEAAKVNPLVPTVITTTVVTILLYINLI